MARGQVNDRSLLKIKAGKYTNTKVTRSLISVTASTQQSGCSFAKWEIYESFLQTAAVCRPTDKYIVFDNCTQKLRNLGKLTLVLPESSVK